MTPIKPLDIDTWVRFQHRRPGHLPGGLLALVLLKVGVGDCPTRDASGKCGMPSHMNW
jgi:hypothetical protein